MKRALKFSACLSLLALALCLWACQSQKESSPSSSSQGLRIVTSFYPIYSMVKAISGDLNDVRMIQSSSGIHDFEPSANDVAAIYDADVFVYHSRTLESWAGELNPSLKNSKVQVLEASQGMKLDRVAGLEDVQAGEGVDEKTLYDPHTWLAPQKAAEEAQIIADRLSELDSDHRDTYQANARKFQEEAKELTERYQEIFGEDHFCGKQCFFQSGSNLGQGDRCTNQGAESSGSRPRQPTILFRKFRKESSCFS